MLDWKVLLSARFWFTAQPGPLMSAAAQFLLVVFAVCLFAAIIFYLVERRQKTDKAMGKLLKKFQSLFTTLGLVGFVILFFFQQQVPYLSSRFWLIVWLLVAIVWAGFIGQFGFFELPEHRTKAAERERLEKYLPKKKK